MITQTPAVAQSLSNVTPATWDELLSGAYHPDDDTWSLGQGGSFLLDVLMELMHPGADSRHAGGAPPAITDAQLRAALDRLGFS